MKRFGLVLWMLVLGGVAIATAGAQTGAKKSAICHRTSSTTSPYTMLRVSGKALKAHLAHPADIFPVPTGGCPRTVLTPTAQGTAFQVALAGEAETPAGDPVATGTATVRLRAGQGQLCYQLAATNLPAATGAHIHSGASGAAGPVVVPLTTPNAAGTSSGCATAARPLVASILKSPADYYVNVHTAQFAGGAIRGQLTGTTQDSFGKSFALDLKGTTEPNAKGTAAIRLRKDAALACYRLTVSGVTLPTTGAHIHRGAAGVNGPVVVPFTAPGASGASDGCAAAAASLIDEIVANPAGFYVNVHTTEHPGGAIRAQLG
jgi:hypothetical protein